MTLPTQITDRTCAALPAELTTDLATDLVVKVWAKTIQLRFGAWKQRRALRRLDADALCDIGITRSQANAEADRGFWDVPANWRR